MINNHLKIDSAFVQEVVFLFDPGKMAQNIPLDTVLKEDDNLAVTVFNRMYKGCGLTIWEKMSKIFSKAALTLSSTCEFSEFEILPESKFLCDKVICVVDYHPAIQRLLPTIPKVLLAYEPPAMDPNAHLEEYQNKFQRVVTFDDYKVNLKNQTRFVKYCYPVLRPMRPDIVPFHLRTILCCLVATNKQICLPEEKQVFELRQQWIEYFNAVHPDKAKVFGKGWSDKLAINGGMIESKDETIKEALFIMTPENMELDGYVTEKLFDAFRNGVVPIYQGPNNIETYIPKNCYIDLRDFCSMKELDQFISHMTPDRYNQYLENIKNFLDSVVAQQFTAKVFAKTFANAVIEIIKWPQEKSSVP